MTVRPERSEPEAIPTTAYAAEGPRAPSPSFARRLDSSYAGLPSLDEPVIDAYVHLGRFADAASFAKNRKKPKSERELLDAHASKPLRAELAGTTILPFVAAPFAGVDFSDSLPGVEAELEGMKVIAHFDSGGAFLVMSPEKARSLGIALRGGGRGFAGLSWGTVRHGIAKSFRIGDALLENVPVAAAAQLKGDFDRVYFGTCILERFFATVDFPSRRLILSPRGDGRLTEERMRALGGRREETPFYLWSDHFMFARGAIGDSETMNYFIDSGLFFAFRDERGQIRRGSLLASPESCVRWGMSPEESEKGYFESSLPISLGALKQKKPYIVSGPMRTIAENFGGMRVDALLSNGFLGGFAWTIDFDRRVFAFTRAE
jgi:hypothetical protein